MSHRIVSASRGAAWITEAVDIAKENLNAFALIGLVYGLISSVPLVSLFIGLLVPVFYGGVIAAFQTQASGGVAQVGQLFEGFTRPGAFARLIVIVLPLLVFGMLAGVVLVISMGPALLELFRTATAGGEPDPQRLLALLAPMAIAALVLLPFAVVLGWLTLLATPRAMLDEVPGVQALGEAWRALWANVGALIVNSLCLMVVGMVLMFIAMIPMMLMTMLLGAEGPGAFLARMLFGTLIGAVMVVLYGGIMFGAWRDIFAATDAVAASTGIEV